MNIDVEGIILPNEPLSNFQLIDAAKKLKTIKELYSVIYCYILYIVFVRDELPKKTRVIECGILNTGDSSTGGYHWLCRYKAGKTKLTFDSYGLPPPVELTAYLRNPVYYNSEQYGDTRFCGHLCFYVLKKT